MKAFRILLLTSILLAPSGLYGERANSVTATVDSVAAMDSNPQVSGLSNSQLPDEQYFTWGVYPTLQFDSRGNRSLFTLNYAFGLNRVENSTLDFDSESHSAGVGWTLDSERVTVRFSERFRKSPDFSTFNLFQGIVFTPQGVFFDYETVALRRDSYENTANLDLDYRIGARSLLSMGAGHSLRDYVEDPLFANRLPDQSLLTGKLGLKRELSPQTILDTGYRYTFFDYSSGVYFDGNNHDIFLGFSHSLTPSVRFSMSAGPSYTSQFDTGLDYWGYNARADITKRFEKELVSLYYSHDNGASVGLGSVSKSDRLGFGLTRTFARTVTTNVGLSYYRTSRSLDNVINLEGFSASAVLNLLLNRHLIINLGASFHTQDEESDLAQPGYVSYNDLERTRFYVSLRLALPEFWRF